MFPHNYPAQKSPPNYSAQANRQPSLSKFTQDTQNQINHVVQEFMKNIPKKERVLRIGSNSHKNISFTNRTVYNIKNNLKPLFHKMESDKDILAFIKATISSIQNSLCSAIDSEGKIISKYDKSVYKKIYRSYQSITPHVIFNSNPDAPKKISDQDLLNKQRDFNIALNNLKSPQITCANNNEEIAYRQKSLGFAQLDPEKWIEDPEIQRLILGKPKQYPNKLKELLSTVLKIFENCDFNPENQRKLVTFMSDATRSMDICYKLGLTHGHKNQYRDKFQTTKSIPEKNNKRSEHSEEARNQSHTSLNESQEEQIEIKMTTENCRKRERLEKMLTNTLPQSLPKKDGLQNILKEKTLEFPDFFYRIGYNKGIQGNPREHKNKTTHKRAPFINLLRRMLNSHEAKGIIEWDDTGRHIVILDIKKLPILIQTLSSSKMTLFASFQRQLTTYGFVSTKSKPQGCPKFQNKDFIKDNPELQNQIRPACAKKRKLES